MMYMVFRAVNDLGWDIFDNPTYDGIYDSLDKAKAAIDEAMTHDLLNPGYDVELEVVEINEESKTEVFAWPNRKVCSPYRVSIIYTDLFSRWKCSYIVLEDDVH